MTSAAASAPSDVRTLLDVFHQTRHKVWAQQPAEIVFAANDRCDQENLLAQLKGGVRALHAPVDNLTSNWAWRVMTALAWNLKAWLALVYSAIARIATEWWWQNV